MAHVFVELVGLELTVLEDAHDDGTGTVGAGMLSEVVRSRELLSTLVAFKRLVVSVERSVVSLQVFLTTEASRAKSADECL